MTETLRLKDSSPVMAHDRLAEILRLLSELCSEGEPVSARVKAGGVVAKLTIQPVDGEGPSVPYTTTPPDDRETTPTEDMILGVLHAADCPLKLVTIAAKADHKNDPHFRKAMRLLVRKGLAVQVEGFRYRLADPSGAAADGFRVSTPCADAIRRMFAEMDRRMTGGEVKHWLEDHGHKFGDSNVEHTLSDMANKSRELTNGTDSRGRGYGLRQWRE